MSNYQEGEEPMEREEPMELVSQARDKDEVRLTFSLKWLHPHHPLRLQTSLEIILLSWFNRRRSMLDFMVERTLRNGSVLVKVTPASALYDLQELNGQTLTSKDGNAVTILSISLAPTILDSQKLDDVLGNITPSASEPQVYELKQGKQSSAHPTARNTSFDGYKRPSVDCLVPVGHYWYVNNIYKEEIKRMEKENKVKMKAHVNVEFEADHEDGNPQQALSEFTKLVQNSLSESSCSVIPLKFVDPDQWSDAMRVIQENKSKLLLTLSSEEVTVYGPSQSQDAFGAALNAMQKINPSLEESKPAPQDASLKAEMAIKYLPNDTAFTSSKPPNVRVKCVEIPKVSKPERKASAASPLHQYQKTTALLPRLKALAREGATAGDDKDDCVIMVCPICLYPLTDKKQLKCKHVFCNECLQEAEKHSGPICPLCKDVFGVMVGDQPDGKMTWTTHSSPLPGFPDCGHISISYDIPSGVQTEKHPNPGQHFFGTHRVSFLPDNKEGNEVLLVLKKAFDQKLIFTVGTSRTTGIGNQVIWNDISHKTSMTGGSECFGYPDPNYLKRVKLELKAKGIE